MQQTQQQAVSQQKQQKTVSSNTTVNSSSVTNVTSKGATPGKTKTWTVQVNLFTFLILFSFYLQTDNAIYHPKHVQKQKSHFLFEICIQYLLKLETDINSQNPGRLLFVCTYF